MRWIRAQIQIGVHLALFALAMQFCLTFSHVDLDGLNLPGSAHGAGASHAAASLVKAAAPNPQGTADADCPICALIQLASISAPSLEPPLPAPLLVGGLKLRPPGEVERPPSPAFVLRARGPPSA